MTSHAPMGVYLEAYLAPLAPWLADPAVTDLYVNRPGELWVERLGGAVAPVAVPELDETNLWRLARQVAAIAHQGVSREHPLLSAVLPDGARVQVVAPPATRGGVVMAIRKHVVSDLSLDDYAATGAFDRATTPPASPDAALRARLDAGDVRGFLAAAVRAGKNIVVSGGTSTGKTTFLNALLKEVPLDQRLVLIEDAPEIRLVHPNAVGLVAARGEQGEARVGAEDLLQASLRLRPDRIILGELRGAEAFSFLRAVSSGHPGSMTTVHADDPRGAVEQLALMALQAGANLRRQDVVDHVERVVDVFVQLHRQDGVRAVREIVFTDR
ncbi:P-type DNA transfer ATPase VirB11 [Caulobacter flavus]|uniref:Type IV secretion system protein n=1 Tax=Caulobacter flavus TaxID=1679497 RepID=A0A2N5CNR1_9CAUL|nr:P-type DNA transfer ATPase VirB11 [Caulobacter flavus]AYV49295.1 P-type DNA transfer ATPase VirB11 [Caulobacter flavus]PLR08295.1 P-type DNA transfer ATPase VirB11 [Caulobacter flavus]